MNPIEVIKNEKAGMDILQDVPRYAQEGWEAITDGDKERLKWAGVFFRRQTPGNFMMRVRIPNGITNAAQLRVIAELSDQTGKGFADLTTRQQVQLRWYEINDVPAIWEKLQSVGLVTLQTGMDNIRNVVGCPMAGLAPHELFDASPVAQEFNDAFVGDRAYTNLPRKFNVTITGCMENCSHAETQDIAMTPALKEISGAMVKGFNVAVGGKVGSGGYRRATPLNVFVRPENASAMCSEIVFIFRDHGPRDARNKARLAFLVDEWGAERFRNELERRLGTTLLTAGSDARFSEVNDHMGISFQKQQGLSSLGLVVPVGRISSRQLFDVARIAEEYGTGEVRITIGQKLIIPNVPDEALYDLTQEPLMEELPYEPAGVMRGLVSCTGIDYCHFAQVETKELAIKTSQYLAARIPDAEPTSIHWSGCPSGCGNHLMANVGLVGKRVRYKGMLVDAADLFVGGRPGLNTRPAVKLLDGVPADQLPMLLEWLIPILQRNDYVIDEGLAKATAARLLAIQAMRAAEAPVGAAT